MLLDQAKMKDEVLMKALSAQDCRQAIGRVDHR